MMKFKTGAIFTVSTLMLALTGCFDSGSDDPVAVSGLTVIAESGNNVTLIGPYKRAALTTAQMIKSTLFRLPVLTSLEVMRRTQVTIILVQAPKRLHLSSSSFLETRLI
ncbi:MAG: hypothetical protein OEM38_04200 [Gammaproteobacteria bacterium]|nr:hypothetical protein [Gammaproteobacteria bacterium]